LSSTPERRGRLALPRGARVAGWVGAAAWAALLYLQSSSTAAGGLLSLFPEGADKVAHAGAYAVLGALLTLGTGRPWLGVLLAAAFGVSDEVHQYFVPGRAAELLDLVADTVGALTGAAFVAFLSRRRRGPRVG